MNMTDGKESVYQHLSNSMGFIKNNQGGRQYIWIKIEKENEEMNNNTSQKWGWTSPSQRNKERNNDGVPWHNYRRCPDIKNARNLQTKASFEQRQTDSIRHHQHLRRWWYNKGLLLSNISYYSKNLVYFCILDKSKKRLARFGFIISYIYGSGQWSCLLFLYCISISYL